ncbi:dUTP diphosphatase [Megasphaera massiliensis]|uniref:dUTP diphosphatase n=1 Tax=Megasphaera massiliensis TaxID=1232428 RepID=UPI0034B4282D
MVRKSATPPKTVLQFKRLTEDAKPPYRATEGSACFDLYANDTVRIYPQRGQDKAYMIPTGIALYIPSGYHVQLFVRSSTGLKTKLRLANGVGVIDSDYTGEVMLLVENIGVSAHTINKGERIAQMMLVKNEQATLEEVEEATKEGEHDGFGSTGQA